MTLLFLARIPAASAAAGEMAGPAEGWPLPACALLALPLLPDLLLVLALDAAVPVFPELLPDEGIGSGIC